MLGITTRSLAMGLPSWSPPSVPVLEMLQLPFCFILELSVTWLSSCHCNPLCAPIQIVPRIWYAQSYIGSPKRQMDSGWLCTMVLKTFSLRTWCRDWSYLEQALVEQGYLSGSTPRKNNFPIYFQVAPIWPTVFQSHVLYKPSQDSVNLSRRQKCNFSSRKVTYTPRRCTEIYPLTCMCYLSAIFIDTGITWPVLS